MKRVLVRVRDKEVALSLKQFGDIESVAAILNIYAITLDDANMSKLATMDGVLKIEENEHYVCVGSTYGFLFEGENNDYDGEYEEYI